MDIVTSPNLDCTINFLCGVCGNILFESVGLDPSAGDVLCLVVKNALSPGSPKKTVIGIGCENVSKVASFGPVGLSSFNILFDSTLGS